MLAGLTTVMSPPAHAANLQSNLLTETFTEATADPRFEGRYGRVDAAEERS
jgi:hypothetical protein